MVQKSDFFHASIVYTPDGTAVERKEFDNVSEAFRFLEGLLREKQQGFTRRTDKKCQK
jgi:NADPH-dependent 7-cyano-7-deazaguanine reductase QueF